MEPYVLFTFSNHIKVRSSVGVDLWVRTTLGSMREWMLLETECSNSPLAQSRV
jgi:hypothetical protein